MKLYPYNISSNSAKLLAEGLGIKRIKPEGNVLTIPKQVVVNWGCSKWERAVVPKEIINVPANVQKASNKLSAFVAMGGIVSIPNWTIDSGEASKWLDKGLAVVCRKVLNGHSGEGIIIANNKQELVDAPLYVQYIPKKEEYRLHVHKDEVFFVQQKLRRNDVPDDNVNWQVRNHQNGFIYANKDIQVDPVACKEAVSAITALGLDFGAVDIIWNQKQDKFYVLEVNTAPGLSGTTLDKYIEQFKIYL